MKERQSLHGPVVVVPPIPCDPFNGETSAATASPPQPKPISSRTEPAEHLRTNSTSVGVRRSLSLRFHSKGSTSTLKQRIKKRLVSSPTVSRKGSNVSDANSLDAAAAVSGRRGIKVKHPDRRALETSEKSVNAAIQYMNIYCAQEQGKDYEQVPVLTEAIVGEVKKLFDVAESLTRDSLVGGMGSMEERKRLLLALAQLVCFADKSYMTEDRSNISTDPSEALSKLSMAVKELKKRVEEIDDGKVQSTGAGAGAGDSTPTTPTSLTEPTLTVKGRDRARHKSVPNVGAVAFQLQSPPTNSISGIAASVSAENLSQAQFHERKQRIPISGSEGYLSALSQATAQPSQQQRNQPLPNHHQFVGGSGGSLTPPPLGRSRRQYPTSPLAKRKSDTTFTFSTDSEVEDSPSDAASLTLSSHVPDEEEPEDRPPLPPKKRNSYTGTPETPSATSAPPEFIPVYADERAKHRHSAASEQPPGLRKRITPSVMPEVSSAPFRRQQHSDSIPKGPIKATHSMGSQPSVTQQSISSGAAQISNGCSTANPTDSQTTPMSFQETLTRRAESAFYPPPLVVNTLPHPDQLPPKKPPKTPRPVSCQDPPNRFSVTTPSTDSRFSYVSDLSSPPSSLAESPPPKPPRTPTARPPKPPRPPTPVQLPPSPENDEPPPLPVKQKRAVAEYNALFGPYEGADDEYNRPLIIARPDLQADVVKQQIAFGTDAVPAGFIDQSHADSETDVVPPLPEKQARKWSRTLSCDSGLSEIEEDERIHPSSSDPSAPDATQPDPESADGKLGVLDSPIFSQNVKDQLIFNEEDGGGASLKGGTVDALIAYAATASASGPDRLYYEAFLMTYRTFVPSEKVVEKLLERHHFFLAERNAVVCHHTLSVLMRVVDDLRGDVNKSLLNRLVDVVYRLICDGELKLATILRRSVIQKWKKLHEPRVSPVTYLLTKPDPNARQKKLFDHKSRYIAEQMSLLDFKFFQNIETPEMLAWAEEQNEEKNPTLTAFTEHFNNVSCWCRTKLIESSDPKEREKVAQKLLKVMKHLREMNNFNSFLAILSAFEAAAISRLEWSDEVLKGLTEPRALLDDRGSFKAYRTALKEAKMPCIPYLGLFLQDLTFIHLGNPGHVDKEKKYVNFNKRWRQFTVLEKIRKCQQTEYSFHRDEVIIRMFNSFQPYLGEEQLYQRSLKLKPRDF